MAGGRPRKPVTDKLRKMTCHLNPALREEIAQYGASQGRSRNWAINEALRFFLAAQKGETK